MQCIVKRYSSPLNHVPNSPFIQTQELVCPSLLDDYGPILPFHSCRSLVDLGYITYYISSFQND